MNNKWIKFFLPHIVAFIILALTALIYFSPAAFEGKVLQQTDVVQAQGAQVELKAFREKEGREILWTNSCFSGMPAFQIWGASGQNYNFLADATMRIFKLDNAITAPHGLIFGAFLGFYLLIIAMKIDWRIAIVGAIVFGLSTSHIILIEAGHLNKMLTLMFLAPTLAGIVLIYRGQYLLGAGITALFTCLQLMANHVQITYYFYLLVAFFVICYLIDAIRKGNIAQWTKASVALALAVIIGIIPNTTRLWTTYEYSTESIRGNSDIIKAGETKAATGLTKEYAFGWSQGKLETFSLLIPNFMGANSSEAFAQDPSSNSYQALMSLGSKNQEQVQQLAQATTHYWGAQPFTSGANYMGAVVFFLFCLACFLIKGPLKWWSIASILLIMMISWGNNFESINYFLFEHFPMFNKFRAVNMVLTLGHFVLLSIGFLGLQYYLNPQIDKNEKIKALYGALSVAGGLCIFALCYGMFSTLEGPNDTQLKDFPQLLNAIRLDRAGLLRGDALRSLGFILATAGLLWASIKVRLNNYAAIVVLGLLAIFDIVGVNKRYLSNEQFVTERQLSQDVSPTNVDKLIQKDKDPYFRVLDVSRGNPYSSAIASYFHKSLGGYHAAKLMIYQDLIDKYLNNPASSGNILSMLNTKYIITNDPQKGQPTLIPNTGYCGNAWFVKNIKTVATSNEELDSLKHLDPFKEVILNKKYADKVANLNIQTDTTNKIALTNYIPDRLSYKYNAKTAQLAVFSEIYYPEAKGWHLYIDGKLQENAIMKANYALRAALVPAGEHTLDMKFEPASYYSGQNISKFGSGLLLFLFAGGLFFAFRKNNFLDDAIHSQAQLSMNAVEAEAAMPIVAEVARPISKTTTETKAKRKK